MYLWKIRYTEKIKFYIKIYIKKKYLMYFINSISKQLAAVFLRVKGLSLKG